MTPRYLRHKKTLQKLSESYCHHPQLCTVDMEIREPERSTISLVPELVFMESDTVLVQYIISSWSLQLRNASE